MDFALRGNTPGAPNNFSLWSLDLLKVLKGGLVFLSWKLGLSLLPLVTGSTGKYTLLKNCFTAGQLHIRLGSTHFSMGATQICGTEALRSNASGV